jgi:hypothetical protein
MTVTPDGVEAVAVVEAVDVVEAVASTGQPEAEPVKGQLGPTAQAVAAAVLTTDLAMVATITGRVVVAAGITAEVITTITAGIGGRVMVMVLASRRVWQSVVSLTHFQQIV